MINKQKIESKLARLDYNESVEIKLAKNLKVTVKVVPDEYPDLSHVGEYSSTSSGISLDRKTGDILTGDSDEMPSGWYYGVEWFVEECDGLYGDGIALADGDLYMGDLYTEDFVKPYDYDSKLMLVTDGYLSPGRMKRLYKKVTGMLDKFLVDHNQSGECIMGNIGADWERRTYEYFNFESATILQHCELDYALAKGDVCGRVGVVAKLYYKGREIGDSSLWGMEYFFTNEIAGMAVSNDHLQEAAYECIAELLAQAGEYDKVASAVKGLAV